MGYLVLRDAVKQGMDAVGHGRHTCVGIDDILGRNKGCMEMTCRIDKQMAYICKLRTGLGDRHIDTIQVLHRIARDHRMGMSVKHDVDSARSGNHLMGAAAFIRLFP